MVWKSFSSGLVCSSTATPHYQLLCFFLSACGMCTRQARVWAPDLESGYMFAQRTDPYIRRVRVFKHTVRRCGVFLLSGNAVLFGL